MERLSLALFAGQVKSLQGERRRPAGQARLITSSPFRLRCKNSGPFDKWPGSARNQLSEGINSPTTATASRMRESSSLASLFGFWSPVRALLLSVCSGIWGESLKPGDKRRKKLPTTESFLAPTTPTPPLSLLYSSPLLLLSRTLHDTKAK
jgi:hypothetical protein